MKASDSVAIAQALEALPSIGVGNVRVYTLQGVDFNGRFFIHFQGALGEQDIDPLVVVGSGLTTDGTTPANPAVVNDYVSVNPITDAQKAALFRESFEFVNPYSNGPSALDGPSEANQPLGSRNLSEISAFINEFSLSETLDEYLYYRVGFAAGGPGDVRFGGNVTESAKTLVFGQSSGNTEVTKIGFLQDFNSLSSPPLWVKILAPIVADNDAYTVGEDSGTTPLDVLTGDTVNPAAGGVGSPSLVAGGLSTVSPAGSATVAIVGSNVNFTPESNFNGQVTFTYQVKDAANPATKRPAP